MGWFVKTNFQPPQFFLKKFGALSQLGFTAERAFFIFAGSRFYLLAKIKKSAMSKMTLRRSP